MEKVINTEKIPIKLWLDDIDEEPLKQAKNLANLPNAFKWVAIMPDCHKGFGMPIGGVLATINAVIPNAVGVDIGCGMCAVKTSLQSVDHKSLKSMADEIRQRIPLGHKKHKNRQQWDGLDDAPAVDVIRSELNNAAYQLGTLGGGNHFIEIQKGTDGYIWIMLHSGSRNFGYQVARSFHKKAQQFCARHNLALPDKNLAYFPLETPEAQAYLEAMNFALEFAKANRFAMMDVIKQMVQKTVGSVNFGEIINIHHNYAAEEHHFGRDVIVHRKGATSARAGQIGIIPGSQGTPSYIVSGKGNPESFMSCSHGAGRKMGRKQAIRTLNMEMEKKQLDEAGIIHTVRKQKDLDEAAGAYKDIDVVMKNQEDLVEIKTKLLPLAVIKA